MVQKTRLTALRTLYLPTPAELGCGLKGKCDYVMVALLVDCALSRNPYESHHHTEHDWI
jgi:hypothetical protein